MVWVANQHTERVTCLVVSEYWEVVVSASSDGTMAACNIKSGLPEWSVTVFSTRETIVTMAAAEDLRMVLLGGDNGVITAYSVRDNKPVELWRADPQVFDIAAMKFILPVGVPSWLAKYVYSYLLTEDSQGMLTARDAKVGGRALV